MQEQREMVVRAQVDDDGDEEVLERDNEAECISSREAMLYRTEARERLRRQATTEYLITTKLKEQQGNGSAKSGKSFTTTTSSCTINPTSTTSTSTQAVPPAGISSTGTQSIRVAGGAITGIEDFRVRRWRDKVFSRAEGKVLDLGVGSAAPNLEIFQKWHRVHSVTCCDIFPLVLQNARKRARQLKKNQGQQQVSDIAGQQSKGAQHDHEISYSFLHADAQDLSSNPADYIPDNTYDTVCISFLLSYCPEPERVLKEANRVVKPSGRILLFERGRSSYAFLRWLTRRSSDSADMTEDGETMRLDVEALIQPFFRSLRVEVVSECKDTPASDSKDPPSHNTSSSSSDSSASWVTTRGLGHFYLAELRKVDGDAWDVGNEGAHPSSPRRRHPPSTRRRENYDSTPRHENDYFSIAQELVDEIELSLDTKKKYEAWEWQDGDNKNALRIETATKSGECS
ncbi:unnamed protein product [Amoebophrya sp. A25]|nr:unnamed protein product [Amoebophrya sp. A25]|eukprot:GSA25T00025017001.1